MLLKSHLDVQKNHLCLLNKCSRLGPALGVFLVVLLKSDLDVQKTHLCLLNKRSRLAPALGVTKFIIVLDMILVTLSCDT